MPTNNNTALLLVQEIETKHLLVELIRQLNKDLILAGLRFQVAEETTGKAVVSELGSFLLGLITHDFGDYLNFLYRVDVSENKLKSLKEINPDKIATAVTQMILEREWQKVWFKNKNRLRD